MKNMALIICFSMLYILLAVGTTSGSSDWHALEHSSYRYVDTRRTFRDAREYCQKFGGDLAQLKTREINDFVQTLIGNQSVWFGLTDLEENCDYQWIDGSSLNHTFTAWNASDASLCHADDHCVQLAHGRWQEHNCSSPSSFVCEHSDFQRVIKRPADVYLWVSNPFASVSDLKVLVITRQQQERIVCKHITYDSRDALTQHISSSIVSLSIPSSFAVHELRLDPNSNYHAAGKIVCGISSEFDEHTTTVSAFHLVPGTCGKHRFGSDCDIACGTGQEMNISCTGSQICRPDPYGCNCMSGYTEKCIRS